MKRSTLNVLHVVLTVPLGLGLIFLIAIVFDTMNWPGLNSWELAHRTVIVVVPACLVLAFAFLGLLRRFRSRLFRTSGS